MRGFDTEKQVLYVVTGLVPERLAKVNTLMKGAISVPDQLFFKQVLPKSDFNINFIYFIHILKIFTIVMSYQKYTSVCMCMRACILICCFPDIK